MSSFHDPSGSWRESREVSSMGGWVQTNVKWCFDIRLSHVTLWWTNIAGWNIPICLTKYIFKGSMFHRYVVLSGFWNMSNSKWETLHDHAPLLKRCWFTTVVVLNAENNQVSDRCTRFPMANVCLKQASCARWFKVTFSSPSWGSLSHLKGSLNHPKRVTKNCVCVCVCVCVDTVYTSCLK